MKSPSLLYNILLLQLLFPIWLIAQDKQTIIPPKVDSLIQLSRSYTAEAEFAKAFTSSASAGKLAKTCCGKQSAAYASYYFNEGRIRYFMGRNEEAIPWYINAKDIRAQVLGTENAEYGKSLNNLAIAYENIGKYELAEPLYLKALVIREATAGRESITYANALNNLAGMYIEMGLYETAERMVFEAKSIRERLLGVMHPYYAASLITLANIYYLTNNFAQAEAFYLEAKNIFEVQEDIDYYSYIALLDNLGAVIYQKQQYTEAELYYQQAAELRQEIYGQESEDYALSLNHLGVVYEKKGQLDAAAQAQETAIHIMEKLAQNNNYTYATYLQDLGDVYTKQGKILAGRDQQQKALDILDINVSKSHPRYLKGLHRLATNEHALGRATSAINATSALAQLEEKPLASAVRHLSGTELTNYIEDFEQNLHLYSSMSESYPQLAGVCYNKIMVYKGFLQNTILHLQKSTQTDTATQVQYEQWRGLHRRLGKLYSATTTDEEELIKLEEEAYLLEKELVRNGADLGTDLQILSWQTVRNQLAINEAAIEFIHYESKQSDLSVINRYAALLLLPEAKQPLFIPLCTATALDSLLYKEVTEDSKSFVNTLYKSGAKGKMLYQYIWEPIVQVLHKQPAITKLYYASAGLLHRINLTAIPDETARTMGQHYQLVALESTRQLALPPSRETPISSPTALLYGGIDYGSADIAMNHNNPLSINNGFLPFANYQNQRGYSAKDRQWQPLSWTEVEIITANDLLKDADYQPQLRMNKEATEASLKATSMLGQSPYLLHLATHGFFFPDRKESQVSNEIAFRNSTRSMIRSGLVMADGNYAWVNGYPRQQGAEDGILTAYEVSQMDLHQTELVVLSACETGLGDIRGTEGVYGLQRAFKIAGARYLIMTLWQVPDFETQAFMTTFYQAWLEEKKSIPDAFRLAQTYMKARYDDAFQWAGFILVE